MKKLLSYALLLFWAVALMAKPVSSDQARVIAQNYLSFNGIKSSSATLSEFNWQSEKSLSQTGFYIFNIEGGGFILISADDATMPVLGYSSESSFGETTLPPSLESMLNNFSAQVEYIRSMDISASDEIAVIWDQYSSNKEVNIQNQSKSNTIEPLLNCLWDQGSPYNALCPQDAAGPGRRVYAGCVATAMAMDMYYYRYPVQPTGTHGYNSDYGYLFVDFSQSYYNYEQMPYDVQSYNYDAAKLQYDCGVAVDMMYSPYGSGAYMDDALNAMKDHFGYNASATIEYKDDYTEPNWIALLKSQLNSGYPLIYAGYDTDAGHAFVCDGYDSNDMFHFNWGWSGSYNGYFLISNLNPGYNFSTGQQAFINCYPASVTYPQSCGNYSMTSRSGSMVVGHGLTNYLNDQSCSWLIAPIDTVGFIDISFRFLSTESGADIVTVYAGVDASAPIVGTYSGTTTPASITINGNKAFVTFTSNSSIAGRGFQADYYGNVPQFCNILKTFSDSSGTIIDGSNSYPYSNSSTCRWKITPAGASGIQIDFVEFSIEDGMDFLSFYDYETGTLVETFTGSSLPQSFFINSTTAMALFRSDESNPGDGFVFNYRGLSTGLEQYPGLMMYLYENSSENPVLHLEKFPAGTYQLRVCDITGKEVFAAPYSVFDAQTEIEIPFAGASSGLYLIHLSNNQLTRTLKYSR